MQLYAFDVDGEKIFVESAVKGRDYYCSECGEVVRLRGGPYKQLHFYHLEEARQCRQKEKSIEHVLTQQRLVASFAHAEQEVRFPTIQRVADVVVWDKKLVFEVQVSPMAQEEVMSRMKDYKSVGFDTIFILHSKNFGGRKVTPAEEFLVQHTHYFSDINEQGGDIFDMLSWVVRRRRLFLSSGDYDRLPIAIGSIVSAPCLPVDDRLRNMKVVERRLTQWRYAADGDLLFLRMPSHLHKQAERLEMALYHKEKKEAFHPWERIKSLGTFFSSMYVKFFERFAE